MRGLKRCGILEDELDAPAHLSQPLGVELAHGDPVEENLPALGSIGRISAAPIVDLPQPLSPTSANVSPRRSGEADAVDRRDGHGLGAGEQATAGLEALVRPETSSRSRSCSCCGLKRLDEQAGGGFVFPDSLRAGRSLRQAAMAYLQRGSNAQPGGIAFGAGTVPGMAGRRSRSDVVERADAGEQALRVGMAGRGEDGLDRAALDDAAGIHDDDVVREFCHDADDRE